MDYWNKIDSKARSEISAAMGGEVNAIKFCVEWESICKRLNRDRQTN